MPGIDQIVDVAERWLYQLTSWAKSQCLPHFSPLHVHTKLPGEGPFRGGGLPGSSSYNGWEGSQLFESINNKTEKQQMNHR